jgi:SAM-dependent methyltransferase
MTPFLFGSASIDYFIAKLSHRRRESTTADSKGIKRQKRWKTGYSPKRRKKPVTVRFRSQHSRLYSGSILSVHGTSRRTSLSQTSTDLVRGNRGARKNPRANDQSGGRGSKVSFPNDRHPIVLRYGRRYMNRIPYLLPCDLKELQRQNLSNILASQVLGGPFSAPLDPLNPPSRILDIGCGSGYWTSLCHDYLMSLGCPPAEFTGFDIQNFAPDLKSRGINWKFVKHDVQVQPWPWDDGYFDLVIATGATMMHENSPPNFMAFVSEATRILAPGGILEVREMEFNLHKFSRNAVNLQRDIVSSNKVMTATDEVYYIQSIDEVAPCENTHLLELASWIRRLLEGRPFISTPVLHLFDSQQLPGFEKPNLRTAAIPLGMPASWEATAGSSREAVAGSQRCHSYSRRNQYQLRELARQVYFGMVEALEPLLREICGKTGIEWDRWWSTMMSSVCSSNGCAAGESVVLGSWWIRKKPQVDSMIVLL